MADDLKTWRGEFCDRSGFADFRGGCRNPDGCICYVIKKDRDRLTELQAQNRKLVEALKRAKSALKPFADRVFNDNGDCTVTDTHLLKPEDFCAADIVTKAIRAAIAEAEKGEG